MARSGAAHAAAFYAARLCLPGGVPPLRGAAVPLAVFARRHNLLPFLPFEIALQFRRRLCKAANVSAEGGMHRQPSNASKQEQRCATKTPRRRTLLQRYSTCISAANGLGLNMQQFSIISFARIFDGCTRPECRPEQEAPPAPACSRP
jgi:hypothetical protein